MGVYGEYGWMFGTCPKLKMPEGGGTEVRYPKLCTKGFVPIESCFFVDSVSMISSDSKQSSSANRPEESDDII